MYFVEPAAILTEELTPIEKIEHAYRMCYKSEDKIKEGSATFITKILNSEGTKCHSSPLGHVWVEIEMSADSYYEILEFIINEPNLWNIEQFFKTEGESVTLRKQGISYVAVVVNLRALFLLSKELDDNVSDAIKELMNLMHMFCPEVFPKIYTYTVSYTETGMTVFTAEDYYTFRVITTRDILQEIARHTTFCLSVESTRYCNYKNGLVFTIPRGIEEFETFDQWLVPIEPEELSEMPVDKYEINADIHAQAIARIRDNGYATTFMGEYIDTCIWAEEAYRHALGLGHTKPQIARMLLPGALKTDMYITASRDAWENFITLRCDGAAHPQIQYLANQIREQLLDK